MVREAVFFFVQSIIGMAATTALMIYFGVDDVVAYFAVVLAAILTPMVCDVFTWAYRSWRHICETNDEEMAKWKER